MVKDVKIGSVQYQFNFLTPEDYDYYFDSIWKKKYQFTSKLDAELEKMELESK